MRHASMAVSAAALFLISTSAGAQQFNLQIYGTLLPFVDSVDTKGATTAAPANKPTQVAGAAYTGANQKRRQRVTTGTSNLGFKGGYDFGDGFGVTFQIESAVPLDNDTTGAPSGTFANRDSYVGITHADYGTLVIGSLDTPYKASTLQLAALRGINPFDYDVILENPGFSNTGTTTSARPSVGPPGTNASFSRRQGNSLQYWTKKFNLPYGSLKGAFGWSVDEAANRIDASTTTHPQIFSGSLEYEIGPVVVRYAHEQHDDYFGLSNAGGSVGFTATNNSSMDVGDKLFARWNIAATNTRIQGAIESLQYTNDDTTPGAVNEYRREAAFLMAVQKFADVHNVWVSYGIATDGKCETVGGTACETNGLGASLAAVGYIHNWTGSIDLYSTIYHVDNKESAQYGPIPVPSNTFSMAPGADATGVGVGVLFKFGAELL